jgi:hypothetical protein
VRSSRRVENNDQSLPHLLQQIRKLLPLVDYLSANNDHLNLGVAQLQRRNPCEVVVEKNEVGKLAGLQSTL